MFKLIQIMMQAQ